MSRDVVPGNRHTLSSDDHSLDHGAETLAGDASTMAGDERTLAGEGSLPRGRRRGTEDSPMPTRIGRYAILGILGSGGMGVVYAAYDPELDRKIALKVLHANTGGGSEGSHQRLVREAQAMARLSHPNVVTVHDVGDHEGRVFLAMEFVEGRTLSKWLEELKPSVGQILDIFVQAGRGLLAAHEKGLVHRDFKPDNVMVGEDGRVRVMDFGLARPAGAAEPVGSPASLDGLSTSSALSSPVTRAGSLVGTPRYMAPEQWSGADVDARTDQFSFCVALYEALYGQRPFSGDALESLAFSVTSGNFQPPPTDLSVPTRARQAIERGLATGPGDRWPSMAPLLESLRHDPARARRRFVSLGATVTVASLAAGGWYVRHSRQIAACDQEARSIASVWADEHESAVLEAFVATGVSYAEDSHARLVPLLDEYARAWAATRRAVCIDHLEGEHRTAQQNRLAAECLDERRQELSALVDAYENAEAKFMQNVILAAAELPPVSQCTDEVWLVERADTPTDPAQRETVDAIEDKLSRSNQRAAVGDYELSARLAAEAVEEAEATGWKPLLGLAYYTLGEVERHRGRYTEARSALHRAFVLAVEAGRDQVASKAAERLALVLGLDLTRPDEGLVWSDIAQALGTRHGRPETGDLHRLRGMLSLEHGDLKLAEQELDRAVELDEAEFGPDHPHTAISLQTRCNLYSDLGRYDEALACNERAIEIQTKFLGPSHPTVAVAFNNLGGLYVRKGDYVKGRAALEEATRIREETLGKEHPETAKSLMNLGAVLAQSGQFEEAEPFFVRAAEIMERTLGHDDPTLANTLANLAMLQTELNDLAAAQRSGRRAVEILERKLGEEHPDLAYPISVLATIEYDLGNYARAEALYNRELAVREKRAGADPIPGHVSRINLAQVVDAQGRHDEARALLQPVLEDLLAKLGPDHPFVGSAHQVLARIEASRGHADRGIEHAEQALDLREKVLGPDDPETARSLALIGELQLDLDRPDEAIDALRRALSVLERSASTSATASARFHLAQALWTTGDRQGAVEAARQASRSYAEIGGRYATEGAEVDAWLRTHQHGR